MKVIRMVVLFLCLSVLVAAPVVAQTDCAPNCVINPDDGGGSGGGGTCWECVPRSNPDGTYGPAVVCEQEISNTPPNFPYAYTGYQSCSAYNTQTAHYCAMGPHNCVYWLSNVLEPSYTFKAKQLEDFLRKFPGVIGRDVDALLARADQLGGRKDEERYYVLLGEIARRTHRNVFDGEVFVYGQPRRHRPVSIMAAMGVR